MRLVITQPDLPRLKQLSYAIAKELNTRLKAMKASIHDDEALSELGDDGISFSENPELKALLEQGLSRPISANQALISEFKELLTQQLPNKIGSTRVQVAIAKAIGYRDWGDLNAKAQYGHDRAESEFESLYGEAKLAQFTQGFLEAMDLPVGLIDALTFRHYVLAALEEIHSPASLQFSSTRHLLVFGSTPERIATVLSRRVEFAQASRHKILVITTDTNTAGMDQLGVSGTVINHADVQSDLESMAGNIIVVAPVSKIVPTCKIALRSRLKPIDGDEILANQPEHLHIVIPDLVGCINDPLFAQIIAQARGFNCSLSVGIGNAGLADMRPLIPLLRNSFDVICCPGTPDEVRQELGANAQPNDTTHSVAFMQGVTRLIKRFL
ncbi:hypothetical protein [Marinobacterium sp. BA1]|uniref:hypothetical protein n=1 Tax=Marinobacterium sp. BA1 TaxID=3138931 RepID=UPI0032E784F6